MKSTLTITAKRMIVGHGPMYQLRDNHGDMVADEGYLYKTMAEAIKAVERMYPYNSVWNGRRTSRGWKIDIN